MVVNGADVTEEAAERIYVSELGRVSRKFTHMRYHSFNKSGELSKWQFISIIMKSWEYVLWCLMPPT